MPGTFAFETGRSRIRPITERRAWIRMPKDQKVTCQPMAAPPADESETAWLGTIRDVSPGGIAVILNRRFEPGTILIVEVSDKPKGAAESRPVRVCHATPETDGRWIIGCAFAWPLSQEELRRFLGE
jgi:PilZ domain